MDQDRIHAPFRTPADAHRLEAMGFSLAEQDVTAGARAREGSDPAFRDDMRPLRELLRPHVFSGRDARDEACRSPMPGGVFALEEVSADDLSFTWGGMCLFAIGHGVDDADFEHVASVIADPEIIALVERCAWRGGTGGPHLADSIVLTVSGAHYQLLVHADGEPEVRAKAPFGAVPGDEVGRTVEWLLERLMARLDLGPRPGTTA